MHGSGHWSMACLAAVLLVSAASAAEERSIVGRYTCVGDAGNGQQYQGTVEVAEEKDTYHVTWNFGGAKTEGLAIRGGEMLSVAIRSEADPKTSGIAVYRIKEDGSLAGRWSYFGWEGVLLTETWTPEGAAPGGKAAATDPTPRSSPPANDAAVKEALAELQGTWTLESRVGNGQPLRNAKQLGIAVTIDGDRWIGLIKGKPGDADRLLIDPTAELKTLERVPKEGRPQLGIYKVEGDALTVAVGRPGGERPGSFESVAGDENTVSVYRRTAPAGGGKPKQGAPSEGTSSNTTAAGDEKFAAAELGSLQGLWTLEGSDPGGASGVRQVQIRGNRWTPVVGRTPDEALSRKIVLAPPVEASSPQRIDLELAGDALSGIYFLDGDALVIAYSTTRGLRPGGFEPDAGGLFFVEHYRRVRPGR